VPFDWVEGVTTGFADAIVVNSVYTKEVFKDAFPQVEQTPDVIYPSVDIHPSIEPVPENQPLVKFLK
jgi:alpha-1,3/alpha-1,6-mannosyltransferase